MLDMSKHEVAANIIKQIGREVFPISGGRYDIIDNVTVSLPAGNGWRVEVTYEEGHDLYTVRKVFLRGLTRKVHQTWEMVDCWTLPEVAYRASVRY